MGALSVDKARDMLEELRGKIDEVDRNLVHWLAERMRLSKQIGQVKRSAGFSLFDPEREEALLKKLVSINDEPLLSSAVLRAVYREILAASRSLQYPVKVAYLGPPWTYSHLAAIYLFGHEVEYHPFTSLDDVFNSVRCKQSDIAVVPVENTLEGSIGMIMELLMEHDLYIVRECYIAMEYTLAGTVEKLGDVKEVYAHPRALNQCRIWLARNLGKVSYFECSSTSDAAKLCREKAGRAALCNLYAAHFYGLNVLAERIADHPEAVTRFFAMGREKTDPSGDDKTSVIFAVSHAPGALYRALEPCARHEVNLCRIESRPTKRFKKDFLFFVDLEGHETEDHVKLALEEMRKDLLYLKVLGSYPKALPEQPFSINRESVRSEMVGTDHLEGRNDGTI